MTFLLLLGGGLLYTEQIELLGSFHGELSNFERGVIERERRVDHSRWRTRKATPPTRVAWGYGCNRLESVSYLPTSSPFITLASQPRLSQQQNVNGCITDQMFYFYAALVVAGNIHN